MTRDDAIAKLQEFPEGNREVDQIIAAAAGYTVDGAFIWYTPEGERLFWPSPGLPHFSTSLDAKLPGENIVHTRVHKGVWTAKHESGAGFDVTAQAHTEEIARRVARLKSMEAEA